MAGSYSIATESFVCTMVQVGGRLSEGERMEQNSFVSAVPYETVIHYSIHSWLQGIQSSFQVGKHLIQNILFTLLG